MRYSTQILLVIILLPFTMVIAQPAVVNKITVIGTQFTSPEVARANCGLKEGDVFSLSKLEDAVQSLSAMDIYEDVKILAVPGPYGYDIEIQLKELPRLAEIRYEGNKKISEKNLNEKITLTVGGFVSPQQVFKATQSIRKLYEEKGYSEIAISTKALPADGNSVVLVFSIDEGIQRKVKSIEFYGISAFKPGKLRRTIDTKQKSLFRSGKFDPEKYEEDLAKIIELYREHGYIMAQISNDSVIKPPESKDVLIKIWVDEGAKYYFRSAKFEGDSVFDSMFLKQFVKLSRGDAFNEKKIEKALENIYGAYYDIGYIQCQVQTDKQISADSIDVIFNILEGPQAYVRLIDISGNTRTFEKVIRREMTLMPGQLFSREQLLRSMRNIYFLNYFDDVVPEIKNLPDGNVDITVKVSEKPIGKFQIGAGYNAQDKLVGNISIGWPNVLGRGWTVDLTWEFGKLRNNISFSFTEPWLFDTPTLTGVDIYNTIWNWENHYSELRQGGGFRLGRKLYKPDYFSVYMRYRIEQVKYYDFSPNYVPSPWYDLTKMSWPKIESSIMFTIERDSRDSRLFATSGSRNSISLKNSGGIIGGEITFDKVNMNSDWYIPLHKYLTFVVKSNIGILTNFWENPDNVPYGERLFPGGVSLDGQIRGYPDRDIGPIGYTQAEYDTTAIPDVGGHYPILTPSRPYMPGGRAVITLSAELRFPIMKDQLYVSLFSDAGNAWLKPKQMTLKGIKRSAGLGVRFVIPMMGILGFDYAYGFDTSASKSKPGWQFHFQLGPEY